MSRACWCAACLLLSACASGCGRPDAAIAAELRQRLDANPALHGSAVSVVVKKRIVLLRGSVARLAQISEATRTVSEVAGVERVIAELRLRDDVIRTSIEGALRHDPLLADVPIAVDVTDGVVRLTSPATNADQRLRAVAVARPLPGVVAVEDHMR